LDSYGRLGNRSFNRNFSADIVSDAVADSLTLVINTIVDENKADPSASSVIEAEKVANADNKSAAFALSETVTRNVAPANDANGASA
jgi:hypothetical protein